MQNLRMGAKICIEDRHTRGALPSPAPTFRSLCSQVRYWPFECKTGAIMTQETYGEVYETGFHLTLRFLRSRGVPWDRASEVTQAAWTKGLERLAQLENDSMVVTWVNAIALQRVDAPSTPASLSGRI